VPLWPHPADRSDCARNIVGAGCYSGRGNPAAHSPGRLRLQTLSSSCSKRLRGTNSTASVGLYWWEYPAGAVCDRLCHRVMGRSPAERIPRNPCFSVFHPHGTQPTTAGMRWCPNLVRDIDLSVGRSFPHHSSRRGSSARDDCFAPAASRSFSSILAQLRGPVFSSTPRPSLSRSSPSLTL